MRSATLTAAFVALTGTSGCFVEADSDGPVRARGELVVDWTIDGTKDPAQCAQGDVDVVDIILLTPGGAPLGEYQQDCAAFATSIRLDEGDYAADVVLLDPSGAERTTRISVRPFSIYGGDQLDIPVDFPASSFR
jgi:hypothetical protein